MTDDSEKDQEYLADIARRNEHIARVTQNCGPEVVKALNESVPFLEDYFLAKGVLGDVPYVPRNKQGNHRYTANSADPDVIAALQRSALAVAGSVALHVPNLVEWQQMKADFHFLAHKNIALAKALGSPPIPRFPPPKLTRSMTQTRLKELAVSASQGLLDTSRIDVEQRPGSMKKLRTFMIRFPTKGELVVLDAVEFDGLSLYASATALAHPAKKPIPLLLFMDTSPASDFAWPAEMPTETRIACSLRVIAAFAAQIG